MGTSDFIVGLAVGKIDGLKEGSAEGRYDCITVGAADGLGEGSAEGMALGTRIGANVGTVPRGVEVVIVSV